MLMALIAGGVFLVGVASTTLCGEIVGSVQDANGDGVSGARISATTTEGQCIGSAITNSAGAYSIADVSSGLYEFTLTPPAGTGLRGQSVEGFVPGNGLTVNWAGASGRDTLAPAMPGANYGNPRVAVVADQRTTPPPGCKGMPGPPAGRKSQKSATTTDHPRTISQRYIEGGAI